jgi:hypothetical protein
MKTYIIGILLLACAFTGFAQSKYYVKTGGTLNGSSWGWASGDLQAMVEKASAGDTVFVSVGSYAGGFLMKDGVTVKGGYTGNKDKPAERYDLLTTSDPAQQSILDGGNTQRVLTQIAPFTKPAIWEGFVLQNGSPAVEFKQGSLLYSINGDNQIAGVLYKYDAETGTGKMISAEETQTSWGGYEQSISTLSFADRTAAKSDLSGAENADKLLTALGDAASAAYYCDTLTAGGYTGWYLPSAGELQEVQEANIQTILRKIGKDLYAKPYWTSSHAGTALAWSYVFGDGHLHPALKYVQQSVTAVHEFILPETPDGIYFAGGGAFLLANGILKDCIVKENTSPSMGGGVYVGAGGQLINCVVEGNHAPEGTEVYYEQTTGITPVNKSASDLLATGKATVCIFDITGKKVREEKNASAVNSSSLPKGVYVVSIRSDTGDHCNYKFIK